MSFNFSINKIDPIDTKGSSIGESTVGVDSTFNVDNVDNSLGLGNYDKGRGGSLSINQVEDLDLSNLTDDGFSSPVADKDIKVYGSETSNISSISSPDTNSKVSDIESFDFKSGKDSGNTNIDKFDSSIKNDSSNTNIDKFDSSIKNDSSNTNIDKLDSSNKNDPNVNIKDNTSESSTGKTSGDTFSRIGEKDSSSNAKIDSKKASDLSNKGLDSNQSNNSMGNKPGNVDNGGSSGSSLQGLGSSPGVKGDSKSDANFDFDQSNSLKDGFGNLSVVDTSVSKETSADVSKLSLEEITKALGEYGFRADDIDRIINEEITIEDLVKEISLDLDNTRRQEMMQASYLSAYGIEAVNLDELNNLINNMSSELSELGEQRKKIDRNRELDAMIDIITRLKMGESLNYVLSSTVVAWQYADAEGNILTTFETPNYNNPSDISYVPISYQDFYQNSELLNKLKLFFEENGISPSVSAYLFTDFSDPFFENIYTEYGKVAEDRESNLKKLDEKIKALYDELSKYKFIYNLIDNDISYYMKNIDPYLLLEDFENDNYFNTDSLNFIEKIKNKYTNDGFIYGGGMGNINEIINDKVDLMKLISCMINGEGIARNGVLLAGAFSINLLSDDDILRHFQKWSFLITEEEKAVFNYIFNTKGTDASYQYLKDISDQLDNRWLAKKTQEDQEFAKEHPIISSLASIIVTPLEGISAMCYSINAVINNEKIRRTDSYSGGIVWRATNAQRIADEYGGVLSFSYSTLMSMMDTGLLIVATTATGGVATPFLSAALMGSRSYVSTLNEALDRGLSDWKAVLLAGSSALVETAMESYSVGHLLNLESKLGKIVVKYTDKIANSVKNESLANFLTKLFYVSAFSLSQGTAEAEEELSTNILLYMGDRLIAGDLSKYSQSIDRYTDLGYTIDEAFAATMNDFKDDSLMAFLGGFVSGILFGAFGGIRSTKVISQKIATDYYSEFKGVTPAQLFASIVKNNQTVQDNANNEQVIAPIQATFESETKDPIVFDNIDLDSIDINTFTNLVSNISNYSELDLPNDFLTVEDYKKSFVNTIIDSGKINEYDDSYIFELIKDSTMLNELIGNDVFNDFIKTNLNNNSNELISIISNLSLESFNKLFDSTSIANYIDSLSPTVLGNIISKINENNSSSSFWFSNNNIKNIISNYSITEVKEFSRSFDGDLNTEIFTKITELKKLLLNEFANNSSLDIKVTSWGDAYVAADPNYSYYIVNIERNGKIEQIQFDHYGADKISITSSILMNPNYISDVVNGSLKILSVDIDSRKQNLVLNETNGFRPGINEIVFLLDGIETKIIINSENKDINLNYSYEYSDIFKDVKDIQIKSITNFETKNVDVDDPNSLYIITYTLDGKTYEKFMQSGPSDPQVEIADDRLNIDEFIVKNSLFGISDIRVNKATAENIKENVKSIKEYSASSDIFSSTQYGGDQSDVPLLVNKYLDGKPMTLIETKKAELLVKLINKYFPNATEQDINNLALHYEEGGCMWMAVSNAFLTYMGSIENGSDIFMNKIGYDLSFTGGQTKSYNMEALAFDMYLSYFSKQFGGNAASLLSSQIDGGVSRADLDKQIGPYFKERGINFSFNALALEHDDKNLKNALISRLANNNGFSIIVAKNFDINITIDNRKSKQSFDGALAAAKSTNALIKGIGSHGMLFTGINDNLDIEVSTWSNQAILSVNSVIENQALGKFAYAAVVNIDFSIPADDNATASDINKMSLNTDTINSSFGKNGLIDMLKNVGLANRSYAATEISIKNLIELISIHDDKYGLGSGLEQLKTYIDKNDQYYLNPTIITTQARGLLKQFTPDQISAIINTKAFNEALVNKGIPTVEDVSKIHSLITKHDAKYGKGKGISELRTFSTENHPRYGDLTLITSQYGARAILKQYTPKQIEAILNMSEFKEFYNNKVASYKKYLDYDEFVRNYASDEAIWKNGLDSEEKLIIEGYLQENYERSYKTINGLLRKTLINMKDKTLTFYNSSGDIKVFKFKEFEDQFGEKIKQFISRTYNDAKKLNRAITKNTLKENTVVYRGVDFNSLEEYGITSTDTEAQIREKLIGQNYTDPGFMSSSPDPSGGFSHKEIVFEMNCPEGTPFGNFSTFNSFEKEILLPLGTVFEIYDVRVINGKTHIYMTKK